MIQIDEKGIKKFVAPIVSEWTENMKALKELKIEDQETADMISDILKDVHKQLTDSEAKRKEVTGPLNQVKKTIDSWFKPGTEALTEVKKMLLSKIGDYRREIEEKRIAALEAGDTETAISIPMPTVPSGVTERKIWTYEVEDESAVPREFLTVDYQKISSLVANSDPETLSIPGVRVFQISKMQMSGGRK